MTVIRMDLKRKDYFEVEFKNLSGISVDSRYNIDQDGFSITNHSGTYMYKLSVCLNFRNSSFYPHSICWIVLC